MTRTKKTVLAVLAGAALLCIVFVTTLLVYSAHQNQTIHVTAYTVTHAQIPASFEGKRLVQLTDLHNKDFGEELTELVRSLSPDVIVVTGDWIGKIDTDITVAKKQASALVGIAPIYYVAGNHEASTSLWPELEQHLRDIGFVILENEAVEWEEDGETIQLVGVFDPEFSTHLWRDYAPLVKDELYSVLLYHRPERIDEAVSFGADLVLSGHTHGGQIRLPWIGSVYAPNQGWFPAYDVGEYTFGDTTMIVGQGLGESVYFRVLTPPEVVVVTLDSPLI